MLDILGENINFLMGCKHLTINDLAQRTGIPPSTLKKIKNKTNTNPTVSTLIPLANFFDIPLDQLLHENLMLHHRCLKKPKLIPIISWQGKNATQEVITSEKDFSADAFALPVELNAWKPFPYPGYFLIEPNLQAHQHDFVITRNGDSNLLSVKQFYTEDEAIWLKSINIDNHIIPHANSHQILGVLVEYRRTLKILSQQPRRTSHDPFTII